MYRIGFSKDIHRLVENRKLIIGGIIIPFSLGEDAHSDGDVLFHALAEAILGALCKGDLGTHFPDNIKDTEGMDSSKIISYVYRLIDEEGYQINNVDIFISLEQPKLKDYILKMRENVSFLLHTDINNISIKCGTNEGMDAVGSGKAIECFASVLLKKK